MDQLQGLNNPCNGEEDGFFNNFELSLDPEKGTQMENAKQTNFDLFNQPGDINIDLN